MERWTPKLKQEQCLPGFTLRMWTDKDGEYVLYTDHIAETRKLIDTYDLLISQEDKKIAELEAENKRLREALKYIAFTTPGPTMKTHSEAAEQAMKEASDE
jgi:cell shape-determining protein MreC